MNHPQPLLEVVTKAAGYLQEKGVPQARLDAELLLARVLEVKRLDLYLQFDRPLSEPELAAYRAWIRRRGQREPLQHIVGEVEFRELRLKVDRRALIPRPETELMLDLLKRHLPKVENPRVLDIGVGSGAIALSVAREFPSCVVSASDIDPACLELTRENAARNGLPEPELVVGSLFDPFPEARLWHAVVSNPPYVAESDFASLQPEVRDFDPRKALVGGPEGWELPWAVLSESFQHVEPGGLLLMELDPEQHSLLKEKALAQGWKAVEAESDYQQMTRFLIAFR